MSSISSKKLSVHDLVLIPLFTALMAVCAWITIPVPNIPFTLQLLAVFAALFFLGGKNGTISIALYILLGAVGAPVFSGFGGGLGKLLGTTGGYIVGFLFSGLVYWLITSLIKPANKTMKSIVMILAALAGLIVCYFFGTVWFMVVYLNKTGPVGVGTVLMWCVVPYIIPDLVKIAVAYAIVLPVKKALKMSN